MISFFIAEVVSTKARAMDLPPTPVRTLSRREAVVLGWLESERRPSVTTAEAATALAWNDKRASEVLSQLAQKGWLQRVARGRYETVLAETGGWSVPNPWAALSLWEQRYYVGFQSAAYELGLTPDRPASVQACVPPGARRPRSWNEIPIGFIYQRAYNEAGCDVRDLHEFPVRLALIEKVLIDGAAIPARVGGIFGLARIFERAFGEVSWAKVIDLSGEAKRDRVSLRRLAALTELLGHNVPQPLARAAIAHPGESPLFLAERRLHGGRGRRLERWQVVVNIDPDVLREEIAR